MTIYQYYKNIKKKGKNNRQKKQLLLELKDTLTFKRKKGTDRMKYRPFATFIKNVKTQVSLDKNIPVINY